MKKTKNPSSVDLLMPIKKLSKRFHLIMFFILVAAGLFGAIFIINNALKDSSADPNYISPINTRSIDQATLTRLNSLHTSSESNPAPAIPSGRINPVSE